MIGFTPITLYDTCPFIGTIFIEHILIFVTKKINFPILKCPNGSLINLIILYFNFK